MATKRFIAKNGLDNNAQTIQNVADPVNAQDVATRAYVLANAGGGGGATTAYTRTSFTATAGQTSFTVTYTVGFAEVYLNGVLLNSTDYTASTGTTIVLTLAAVLSDIVEVIAYNVATVSVTDASSLATGTVPAARLGSGTADNTTYLKGNNTWGTLTPTSPAGTTGQVQFNNAGAFAPASYVNISGGHLNATDAGTLPATPAAGTLTYFAEDHAGRMLPSVIGPSGVDLNLQAALYGSTTYMWLPSGNAAVVSIAWGTVWTPRNTTGAQSSPVKASTNAVTSMSRALFSSTATINTGSGTSSASTTAWLGNGAGLGGFLFFARFGVETYVSTCKVLVGLSALNAVLSTITEPSAIINTIALCKDSTDSTWQIVTKSATTVTKINTTITVTAGQILDLFIHSAPNSQSVKFHIKNGATGAVLYVSPTAIATNLPANTVFLNIHAQIMNTASGIVALALNRLYLESDL